MSIFWMICIFIIKAKIYLLQKYYLKMLQFIKFTEDENSYMSNIKSNIKSDLKQGKRLFNR